MSNKYLSAEGTQRFLLSKLNKNEEFRNVIFQGQFYEAFSNDKLDAASQRALANYRAGLMYIFYLNQTEMEENTIPKCIKSTL